MSNPQSAALNNPASLISPAPPPISFRQLCQPGLNAVAKYWPTFLLIQALALFMLLGYFYLPPVTAVCQWLADTKAWGGVLFAGLVSAIAAGIIPELAKFITGHAHALTKKYFADVTFNTFYFFLIGMLVDLFYALQNHLFGSATLSATIIKTLVDQFIFTPFIAVPLACLVFPWRDAGFRFAPVWADLDRTWFLRRALPLTIPCWCYWIPMVFMIYTLPRDLQLTLFALASAAWSMVMIYIASSDSGRENLS